MVSPNPALQRVAPQHRSLAGALPAPLFSGSVGVQNFVPAAPFSGWFLSPHQVGSALVQNRVLPRPSVGGFCPCIRWGQRWCRTLFCRALQWVFFVGAGTLSCRALQWVVFLVQNLALPRPSVGGFCPCIRWGQRWCRALFPAAPFSCLFFLWKPALFSESEHLSMNTNVH
ncbi:hypothetical protein T10_12383 [Trichinella papuae]|uniref:Uncharacterized protein n=1 Tax=Trichinella papuae TaxID=268474 RepID=A0A0V1MIY7_9BILA|nr:hypothetical protein T10_12383 [Trichinella papuae]